MLGHDTSVLIVRAVYPIIGGFEANVEGAPFPLLPNIDSFWSPENHKSSSQLNYKVPVDLPTQVVVFLLTSQHHNRLQSNKQPHHLPTPTLDDFQASTLSQTIEMAPKNISKNGGGESGCVIMKNGGGHTGCSLMKNGGGHTGCNLM